MSIDALNVYLVGGAVRDTLLGLPVTEKDWVVVGSTPGAMESLGFRAVGKDFPVFLHPETHEEYALARSERKVGKGYKGFVFHTDADVTLEADLKRRDLTINAIAQAADGSLIDPFNGQADLKQRSLHHVSEAFAEDPVRILRIARFAAKLPDFTVHPTTNALIQTMVGNGEVNALVSERVWKELHRALLEKAPQRFFAVLADGNALKPLFPEIALNGQGMQALQAAVATSDAATIRLAALLHDLSPDVIKTLCHRLRIPKAFSQLATGTAALARQINTIDLHDPRALLHCLKQTDALRHPDRFADCLTTLTICYPAQQTFANALRAAGKAVKMVDTHALQAQGLRGQAFAQALEALQLDAIQHKNH